MRKQYHFRKIGNDTYIWDVHHLLELTKNFKVKEEVNVNSPKSKKINLVNKSIIKIPKY